MLGLCCAAAHEALPGRLAWSVYVELLAALEQVLLDGGPLRLFVPDDVDVLEADLAALQALFHADADGLDMEDVERAAEGLGAVLDAMALETPVLVANYKQALAASGRPLARAATAGPAAAHLAAALDPDVLLRVLCHRAEHAASKFLKGLKIGKQLPLTVQGQASEALQKVRSKAPSGGGLLRGFSRSSSTTSGGGSKATPAAPSRFGPAPRPGGSAPPTLISPYHILLHTPAYPILHPIPPLCTILIARDPPLVMHFHCHCYDKQGAGQGHVQSRELSCRCATHTAIKVTMIGTVWVKCCRRCVGQA